jgi:PAS domain S-box-containing protein
MPLKTKSDFSAVVLFVAVIVAVGLTATVLAYQFVRQANDRQLIGAVNEVNQDIKDYVLDHLVHYQHGLRGARGAILAVGDASLSQAIFQRYMQSRDLQSEFPGAHGFGFIRRVAPADLERYAAGIQAEEGDQFQLQQFEAHGGERFIVQYVEPQAGNQGGLGVDIASEPNRRRAALAAMRTGDAQLTAPVFLRISAGQASPSVLFLLPVYRTAELPPAVERDAELVGWTFTPLIIREVLARLPMPEKGVQLHITDVTDPAKPHPFFSQGADQADMSAANPRVEDVEVFGRRWQFVLTVGPAFVDGLELFSPKVVWYTGGVFTTILALCGALLGMGSIRRQRLMGDQLRLAAIVESSTDGIIGKDLDGIVTSWNSGAEVLFGYRADEAIGRRLDSLVIPPDRMHEEQEILEKIRRGQYISNFDTIRHRKDGALISVAANISPILDARGMVVGASKTVRDVAEQQRAKATILELNARLEDQVSERTAQLRDANLLLTSVLRAATDVAIIATGRDGLIQVFNEGAERMLGYSEKELVGAFTPRLFHIAEELAQPVPEEQTLEQQAQDAFQLLIQDCGAGASSRREWTFERKDGSRFPVTLMVSEIRDETHELTGYLGIAVDITAQRDLQANLVDAKDAADAASDAKTAFLANMSHEIRTPLNAVLGMLQLLASAGLEPRQAGYVNKAQIAARSLLGLLNDILDYSKIEAGKLQLDVHPFELTALLEELEVILDGNNTGQGVEVILHLDPQLGLGLLGDSLRLQQVLINLAGNALKFTHSGAVQVRLVCVEACAGSRRVRVEVEDSGIGISEAQLQHIFQSFSQAQGSTTRRYGGTGLGLAICKRLVELMGGELQVRSEVDRGSCFWFDIDLQVDPDFQQGPRISSELAGISQELPLSGLRVLVVEDNALNREVALGLLTHAGAGVTLAEGGLDGIACLEREPQGFDAVLMDLQMPDIDGFEVTRRLRQDERFQVLPIIAMTANASREDQKACRAAGMNAHLGKPIDYRHLVAALRQWARRPVRASAGEDSASLSEVESLASITARLGGNHGLRDALLRRFEQEVSQLLNALEQALEIQDLPSAARALHTLKGTAGNLGARALSASAAECEQRLLEQPDVAPAQQLSSPSFAQLRALATRSTAALAAMIQSPASTPVRPQLAVGELRRRLQAIEPLLAESNLRGVLLAEALAEYELPVEMRAWKALAAQLATADLETAAATVRQLLDQIEGH